MPSEDQAWVAAACNPVSADVSQWPRYRIGDVTVRVPSRYRASLSEPYTLSFRGQFGSLTVRLHRNARYDFDELNVARRGQNWCNGTYSGYKAEVLSWKEGFTYRLVTRWPATWGGQDDGKWLFATLMASRIEDARLLRAALHTIEVAPVPGR